MYVRKGQLLVKLGHYHAEPHEAEATPQANLRTEIANGKETVDTRLGQVRDQK